MLQQSDICCKLSLPPFPIANSSFYLFGDERYELGAFLLVPWKGTLTELQKQFNSDMASVIIAVKQMFGRVSRLWRMLNNDYELMTSKVQVAAYYRVGVLFTNVRTAIDGRNQYSDYFYVSPPTAQ